MNKKRKDCKKCLYTKCCKFKNKRKIFCQDFEPRKKGALSKELKNKKISISRR